MKETEGFQTNHFLVNNSLSKVPLLKNAARYHK